MSRHQKPGRAINFFAAASASTALPSSGIRTNVKRGTVTYWLTVIASYYVAVMLKALVWAHNHGGYAAHNMRELISVTLRTTTVDAGILLALIFALNKYMALKQQGATRIQTANVAPMHSAKRRDSGSM